MGKILGIDYGRARIGLALSDLSHILASPHGKIKTGKSHKDSSRALLKIIEENSVEQIVIGLPLLLSGKDSETTLNVRAFAEELKKISQLPITLWDERLTSKEVERTMMEAKVNRKKRAAHVDTLSATLILQSYLDSPKP